MAIGDGGGKRAEAMVRARLQREDEERSALLDRLIARERGERDRLVRGAGATASARCRWCASPLRKTNRSGVCYRCRDAPAQGRRLRAVSRALSGAAVETLSDVVLERLAASATAELERRSRRGGAP